MNKFQHIDELYPVGFVKSCFLGMSRVFSKTLKQKAQGKFGVWQRQTVLFVYTFLFFVNRSSNLCNLIFKFRYSNDLTYKKWHMINILFLNTGTITRSKFKLQVLENTFYIDLTFPNRFSFFWRGVKYYFKAMSDIELKFFQYFKWKFYPLPVS